MDEDMPSAPGVTPAPQQASGTKRTFGDMLNQDIKPYAPRKYMKHAKKTKSPWNAMSEKQHEAIMIHMKGK
jgi:hypothetical protein